MTLPYTLAQARTRAENALGTKGIPNDWWPDASLPWDEENDCLKGVLYWLGFATRKQQDLAHTSISNFRAHYGWEEVTGGDIRAGDVALFNFDGGRSYEHAGLIYSIDHPSGMVTTIEANTSPAPGVPITAKNRGVYRKTRPIRDGLVAAFRPAYKSGAAVTTSSAKIRARRIGTWLNRPAHLPAGCHVSAVGDYVAAGRQIIGDGVTDPAPIYWRNVQTWGSQHDADGKPVARNHAIYGPTFLLDGIPAARSRYVETVLDRLSKAAK